MVDENMLKLRQIELELLDEFVSICDEYGLRYYLAYGTCLGAVRHGGFIPWDDDIDVGMPREDYDEFVKIVTSKPIEWADLQSMETEPRCGLVFGKLRAKNTTLSEKYSSHLPISQGVWIDIFPMDRIPNDLKKRDSLNREIQLLRKLYIVKCGYKTPEYFNISQKVAYIFAKMIVSFISRNWLIERLYTLMTSNRYSDSIYLYSYGTDTPSRSEGYPEYELTHYSKCEFEGRNYNVPLDVDAYLRFEYGDYMRLPPEGERVGGSHIVYEFRDDRG